MLSGSSKSKIFLFVLIQILFSNLAFAGESQVWSFVGRVAPDHWSKLDKEFQVCSDGPDKGSIAVPESDLAVNGDPIIFDYKATNDSDSTQSKNVRIGDVVYKLVEFHIRVPAKHSINNKVAKAAIHFIHQDSNNNIAIVAVMIKEGSYNATIEKLLESTSKSDKEQFLVEDGDLTELLPVSKEYYFQKAKMMTPPCKGKVNWYIMKDPIDSSAKEIIGIDAITKETLGVDDTIN